MEIQKQADSLLGGPEVVQKLGHVLGGQAIYTFQLDDYGVFDENIWVVVSYALSFLGHRQVGLGGGDQAP